MQKLMNISDIQRFQVRHCFIILKHISIKNSYFAHCIINSRVDAKYVTITSFYIQNKYHILFCLLLYSVRYTKNEIGCLTRQGSKYSGVHVPIIIHAP